MDQFLVDLYDHMVSHSELHDSEQGGMGLECDVDGEVAADGWGCSDHHVCTVDHRQRIWATCSQQALQSR